MKKLSLGQWVAVIVAIIVVVWFVGASNVMNTMTSKGGDANMMNDTNTNAAAMPIAGLTIEDTVVGTGAVATPGTLITANYTGMFEDGRVFDTSIGRAPFSFPLGAGAVIQGWDKGIVGMKVGGKRKLIISPQLGYGMMDMKDGAGNIVIPANSTLIFEVELLDVK